MADHIWKYVSPGRSPSPNKSDCSVEEPQDDAHAPGCGIAWLEAFRGSHRRERHVEAKRRRAAVSELRRVTSLFEGNRYRDIAVDCACVVFVAFPPPHAPGRATSC